MAPMEYYIKWNADLIEKPTITIFDYRERQKKKKFTRIDFKIQINLSETSGKNLSHFKMNTTAATILSN